MRRWLAVLAALSLALGVLAYAFGALEDTHIDVPEPESQVEFKPRGTRFAVPDTPPPGMSPQEREAHRQREVYRERDSSQLLAELRRGQVQLFCLWPGAELVPKRNFTLRLLDEEERSFERRFDRVGRVSVLGLASRVYEIDIASPLHCLLTWADAGGERGTLAVRPGVDLDLEGGIPERFDRALWITAIHASAFVVLGDELLSWKVIKRDVDTFLPGRIQQKVDAITANLLQRWPHARTLVLVPRSRDPATIQLPIRMLLARSGLVERTLRLRPIAELTRPAQFRAQPPADARVANLRIDVVDPAGNPQRFACCELFPRDVEMPAFAIQSGRDYEIAPGRYLVRAHERVRNKLPRQVELSPERGLRTRIKLDRY